MREMHQELKNQVDYNRANMAVLFFKLSVLRRKNLENVQVEEAVKHNSAKLDETLTKVDLLILIS